MLAGLMALACISGIARQIWLEQQLHKADICIVLDGPSCGSSNRCYIDSFEESCKNPHGGRLLFSGEEYINVFYSRSSGITLVNFAGMQRKVSYMLCRDRLVRGDEWGIATCDIR